MRSPRTSLARLLIKRRPNLVGHVRCFAWDTGIGALCALSAILRSVRNRRECNRPCTQCITERVRCDGPEPENMNEGCQHKKKIIELTANLCEHRTYEGSQGCLPPHLAALPLPRPLCGYVRIDSTGRKIALLQFNHISGTSP